MHAGFPGNVPTAIRQAHTFDIASRHRVIDDRGMPNLGNGDTAVTRLEAALEDRIASRQR